MWGIWQVKEQCWTSWDGKAVWPKQDAEQHKQELEKIYRETKFEVRELLASVR